MVRKEVLAEMMSYRKVWEKRTPKIIWDEGRRMMLILRIR